jgi:D-alanyl-D-alanine carboxypeptidase/D-alanyl-D-alanine-endopeptidase (penicillin-binding protein 4)
MVVRALRHAGKHTGVLVYDLTAHQTLFTVRPGVARPPASLEKIYTTVALLSLLGPEARFHTDLLGSGHPGPGGVWHGNLYLRGGGDPTFGEAGFVHVWDGGHGSLVGTIVDQLRGHGIRRVTGRIYGDGSRFDGQTGGPFTGGQPDIPDYGGEMSALTFDHGATTRTLGPAEFAARQLARSLRAAHVRAKAATVTRRTPPRARRLARVASPPLAVLLKLMDVPSDDLLADLLTKQLGYRFGRHGTLDAGAVEIRSVLDRFGIRPRLHDGSGLDHTDRTTPDQLISLLRQIWGRPLGRMLATALPVVGESGTVQGIAAHTPAQGHCVAKTGTLYRVTNLAGVCTARDAHELAFALFVDGPNNWQAFPFLGRVLAALAGY